MARAGRLLDLLDRRRLPIHVTPAARELLAGMAEAAAPFRAEGAVRRILDSPLAERALSLPPRLGELPDALLRNTVSAKAVRGGDESNVVPGEVVVHLDGRLLPGQSPEDLILELGRISGDLGVRFEVLRHDPGPPPPDMGLFPVLKDILREADPGSVAVPLLAVGSTDARHFARLGIQTYGFLPMNPPPGAELLRSLHGPDERIPTGALAFGANAVHEALRRFGEG